MGKLSITYDEYGKFVNQLHKKLKENNHSFAAVHALPRGGLPIGVHLSHSLQIPMISNLSQFTKEFNDGLLLVVDDIIDTGKTFDRFIEFADVRNIRFFSASLYYKPHSEYTPDVYLKETEAWIVFPWEHVDEKPSKYHQRIYSDIFSENSSVTFKGPSIDDE